MPPMTSGDSAAMSPRKISTSSTNRIGSEKISARVMSCSVWVLAWSVKATTPPTRVVRPGAARAGSTRWYAASLPSSSMARRYTAAYVARRSLLTSAGDASRSVYAATCATSVCARMASTARVTAARKAGSDTVEVSLDHSTSRSGSR